MSIVALSIFFKKVSSDFFAEIHRFWHKWKKNMTAENIEKPKCFWSWCFFILFCVIYFAPLIIFFKNLKIAASILNGGVLFTNFYDHWFLNVVWGLTYKNRTFSALFSKNCSPLLSINQIYEDEFSSRRFGKKGGEMVFSMFEVQKSRYNTKNL